MLLALAAVVLGELAHDFGRLPNPVAAYFDLAGSPNGWVSRDAFAIIASGLTVTFGAIFLGFALTLPACRTTCSTCLTRPTGWHRKGVVYA